MTKTLKPLLAAMVAGLVLVGCGGGGSDSSSSGSNSGGGSSGGGSSGGGSSSGGGTASACSGNIWQTVNYDVYASGSASPVSQAANFYGASSSASTQCVDVASTLQLSTTDGFNNVSWVDNGSTALGASAERLDAGLLLTCSSGADTTRHLAVRADGKVAAADAHAAAQGHGFDSLECSSNGGTVEAGVTSGVFNADGTLTLTDGSVNPPETTTWSAAEVDAAFGSNGYTVTSNGVSKTFRLTLYAVPAAGASRQAIVFSATKSDGSVINPFVFVQQ